MIRIPSVCRRRGCALFAMITTLPGISRDFHTRTDPGRRQTLARPNRRLFLEVLGNEVTIPDL